MSIIVNSLAYMHADREMLFENLSFSIAQGQKAALVGINGAGKSTLLQIVAGRLQASAGVVASSEKPYYVPQQPGQYDALTVAEALGVATKLTAYEAILQGDASLENFNVLNDDWTIEERVQQAFNYWNLHHITPHQPMHQLSGGEKTKALLAGILIHEPAVILLDEPTNHLDVSSRKLLYDFINQSKETILVVSHDRTLLNLMEVTLELSQQGIEVFGGNYDFYKTLKDRQLDALETQHEETTKLLKQMQQKAREMVEQRQKQEARGKADGQKQNLPKIVAGNLKTRAEESSAKMKEVHQEKIHGIGESLRAIRSRMQEQQVLRIDLRKSDLHKGKILIEAKKMNFGYGDTSLWAEAISFQIRSGDRLRIDGDNGSGKTTLLKLIMGRLEPTAGEIYRADFQYLYIDQHYSQIDNNLTVLEQTQKFNSRLLPGHDLKMLLHYHRFPRETWDRKCEGLSGGEKVKLMLCCLAASNQTPDLLILDEPTNNLDVYSQDVLTEAMKQFNGSLLIIAHDSYFIEQMGVDKRIVLGRA